MTKRKLKSNMYLTPAAIVQELDRFIVGQDSAKRSVAIALRNRYRRILVPEPMRSEIFPKNILMIGSTGVGKTEIARRLAKLSNAPFIKVEATKFTEIGYVGRDVESIIRDLVEVAINQAKASARVEVEAESRLHAIERILDVVTGKNASSETRDKFRSKIVDGKLDDTEIEISVADTAKRSNSFEIPGMPGSAMGIMNISDILGKAFNNEKLQEKKLKVSDALEIITAEECEKMLDQTKITNSALKAVANDGIVFLDELDKITSRSDNKGGDVSREGVQRDLLPLIEGTNVVTKHGTVKTDHILFIASGAFHIAKPSDLLPELQGRLPIRVELKSLTKDDMVRILLEPESSLINQYIALMATEDVELEFNKDAISLIAEYATNFNRDIEDIGARRLHTILEKLLEDISFNAGSDDTKKVVIDEKFVTERIEGLANNRDLAKFIL